MSERRADAPPVDARALLPDGAAAREVLARRAEELLRSRGSPEEGAEEGALFLRVHTGGGERFGLPHRHLDEILYPRGLRRVPGAPAHIAGVINRRGELLAVIDLNPLFSRPPQGVGEASRIVVVRSRAAGGATVTAGLLVAAVEDEERYREDRLERAFAAKTLADTAFVRGLHQGRVTLLDPDALLHDPALWVDDSK
ncbi:chemotaxis protein CheW [Endothiovibrio diazotrophicus]